MKKLLAPLAALLLSGFSLVSHAATFWSTQDYDLYPGDFNGDGKTDLLYVAKDVTKPSGIALSDGNGPNIPFQSWVGTHLGIPWSSNTYKAIVADFNGDGRADVFMQRSSPGDHFLLLANAEGKLMAISQTIANSHLGLVWSADQHVIAAGDFNGDGKADLLLQATKPSLNNAVVLANGSGTFTSGPTQSWNDGYLGFKWSTQNALLHVGDFNGDGKKDLLLQTRPRFVSVNAKSTLPIPVPTYRPNMNAVMFSQAGASPFQQAGVQAFSRKAFGGDFSPLISTVVIGDFNGDGRADILLQSRSSSRASYLLNGNVSGAAFATATTLASNVTVSTDNYRVITGNFDGSGGAGVYLQAVSPQGNNVYSNVITSGTITTAAHELSNATGGSFPVTATGVTPGSFAIGDDGTANYSVPIVVPPGVGGVQPQLALTYSSQRGNGWLGIGWDISGLSQITRCRRTFAQDGVAGPVELSMNDKFCLDGVRLRRESGSSYGADGSVYRTEIESFSRITAYGTTGRGPVFFKVEAKNGLIYEYGNTDDSRIESLSPSANTIPRTWALNKVSDRAGNTMTVSYMEDKINGSFHPTEMLYTFNAGATVDASYKVKFVWDQRASIDPFSGYFAGGLIREAYRLNRIETMFKDPGSGNTDVDGFRAVRKYHLTYDLNSGTNRSRLVAVQECEYSGTCLSPTNIGWQQGQSGLAEPVVAASFSSTPLDMNGDGRTDIVRVGPGATITYQLANSSGGFNSPQEQSTLPLTVAPIVAPGLSYIPFDYNNDGKTDILATTTVSGVEQYVIAQSTGTGFTLIPTGIPYSYQFSARLADVNGDGRLDFITAVYTTTITVRFNSPSGFGPPVTAFTGQTTTGDGILAAGDFNADDRTDLLILDGSSSARVLVSQGTTYSDAGTVLLNVSVPVVGDLNGDGIDDVTYKCGSTRCLRFGGAGASSVGLGPEVNTGQPGLTSAFLADWDSDGRADILQGVFGSSNLQLLRSTGETLLAPIDTGIPTSLGAFADANGDGLVDLFTFVAGANNTSSTYLRLHRPGISDLVTSIADGFGNRTTVTYAPLTDATVYTKGNGAPFPQMDVQSAMQVVKQYAQTDGTGGTYTVSAAYNGARIDLSGRGFVGFDSRSLRDSRNNIRVYNYYRRDFPFIGALIQQDELQPDNATIISRITNTYSSTTLGTGNDLRHLVTLTKSVAKRYEVGGTKNGLQISEQTTTAAYDGFANPKDITVNTTDKDSGSPFFDQTWQTRTLNSFANDTTSWCLGRPTHTSVGDSLPDGTSRGRNTSFTVDSSYACRTTQQVIEPNGGPLKVTRNVGYDNCGNVTSIAVIGTNLDDTPMTVRNTSLGYGSRCSRPETITNALGQTTTLSYRYDLGVQSSVTDPNSITTSAVHDNFGRVIRQNRPDGTATDQYYFSCKATNNYCGVSDLRLQVQSVERDSNNATITTFITFFDGLGRERISQAERTLGGASYVHTTYDSLGRQVTRSRPYSTSSNGLSRNTYDLLDRLTKLELVLPNSSVDRTSTLTYTGSAVSVTDAKSRTKQRIFDPLGNLRQVTDTSGTTQYIYAPFQNLEKVIDPRGNATTLGYNIRGFKTSLADPDRGSTTYTYNSLGELQSLKDAKNPAVTFTYDALSRPLTRTEPEGMTAWTWDTATRGIGRLTRVTSPGGYAEEYAYDNLSRPQQVTYTEDAPYQVNYAYNNQGLLDTLTYPTSTSGYRLKLQYAYTKGSLVQVKDFNSPSTVFWNLNATDDLNNPIDETLGNNGAFSGIRQTSSYNQLTGELSIRRGGFGTSTTNLQNLAYQWDLTGNLKQRQDVLQSKTEIFNYDDLDRLVGSTLDGATNLSVGFDSIGNITSKSDVGAYNYTTAQPGCSYYTHSQPHAVRAAGSNTYCYDANGNMTKRAGSTIGYTSYDLPSQIIQGSDSSQFSYDANRQRWRQIATYGATTETTIYIAGLLDKVTRSGVTEYRHYIATGSDASAIYTRHSDGTTTTHYVTNDHLGSSSVITDHTGTVRVRESFTAYGARRGSNWSGTPSTNDLTQIAGITRDGFTGHEHLDNVGLVHMNGRVYDPVLGRFTSADPIVQDPTDSQSLNRYSYVFNSPLSYTDPSGFLAASSNSPDTPPLTMQNIDLNDISPDLLREDFSFIPNVVDGFNKLIGSPFGYFAVSSAFGFGSPYIDSRPRGLSTLSGVKNNEGFMNSQNGNSLVSAVLADLNPLTTIYTARSLNDYENRIDSLADLASLIIRAQPNFEKQEYGLFILENGESLYLSKLFTSGEVDRITFENGKLTRTALGIGNFNQVRGFIHNHPVGTDSPLVIGNVNTKNRKPSDDDEKRANSILNAGEYSSFREYILGPDNRLRKYVITRDEAKK